MQTFLPYPSFSDSAHALDNRRLGKQRVEAKQIYLALTDPDYGWQNHPAVKMWRSSSNPYLLRGLAHYGVTICNEWRARGFQDTLLPWFLERRGSIESYIPELSTPLWLYTTTLCLSHQSNLLRKDPLFYSSKFPNVSPDLPYIWPTNP